MSVSPVLYLQDSSLSGLLVGEKSAYLPKRGEEISFYPLPGCCSLSSTFYHEYLSCCFLFTFWSFQASFLCIRIVTGIKQLPQVLFSPGLLLLPHMVIFSCTACSSLDVSVLGELRSTNIHSCPFFSFQSIVLYWLCSSLMGLSQNLLLHSPRFRQLCRIPSTKSDSDTPYKDLFAAFYAKFISRK